MPSARSRHSSRSAEYAARLRTAGSDGSGRRILLPDLLLTVSVSGRLGPFANCHGFVGRFDKHLASTIHCVDAGITSFVQRSEQRGRVPAVMSPSNLGGD
jgi:hypothetical protein